MQYAMWEAAASTKTLLLAPTGSGKTLAYAGGVLQRIAAPRAAVQAVVLSPTRELALQIYENFRRIAAGYKVSVIYGKHSMRDEVNTVTPAPDILIATPGRLLDHLNRGTVRAARLRVLVIDEYDKLLQMGFETEMKRVLKRLPVPDNIIVTSATPIDEVPEWLDIAQVKVIDFSNAGNPAERLAYHVINSPERDKLNTLAALLTRLGGERTIVFVNHRESAERTFQFLQQTQTAVTLFHGGMEQIARERAVIMLNNNSRPVMVATDLAARGLDIEKVRNIIHYHLPPGSDTWKHRNGRAARVNEEGDVYLIVGPTEEVPPYVTNYTVEDMPVASPSRAAAESRPQSETLYINAGRKEKISRGDIVGFLTKSAMLESTQIGNIDLRDHSAYVSVARSALPVIAALESPKIKGMRVKITPLR